MYKLTSSDLMKLQNMKRILKEIHYQQGIHRKLIAQKTNLASQTITNLAGELCDQGILKEYVISTNTKGRNPVSLMIDYSSFYIVTVNITVTKLEFYINALDGTSIEAYEEPVDREKDILARIKNGIDSVIEKFKRRERIHAVVISTEGLVDEDKGIVIRAKDINLDNFNLEQELSYLNLPIFVRNDVNLIGYYEMIQHTDDINMMVIKISEGIGSALIADRHVLKSTNNVAGELGHFNVQGIEDKVKCTCGKYNCLTKFISKPALAEDYGKSYSQLKADVLAQDPQAIKVIEKLCDILGPILANIIVLLDLDRIVVSGSVIEDFEQIIYPRLDRIIRENLSYWVAFKNIEIHKGVLLTHISSQFILDYYFKANGEKLFLWDTLLVKKGKGK